jgi:hypothetical protein
MLAPKRVYEIFSATAIPVKMLNMINRDEWYHGTTYEDAKCIEDMGVMATYNEGNMLDFGAGFYLTDTFDKADRYMSRVPIINIDGTTSERQEWVVIKFCFSPLEMLFGDGVEPLYTFDYFPKHDERFAKFAFKNRVENVFNENPHHKDIIWGVMSDNFPDKIIIDYKNADITYEEAIRRLLKPNSMKQLYIGNQSLCDKLKISDIIKCRKEGN